MPTKPPLDRESFYGDDDDEELELLPPDPDVIAGEQERARQEVERARNAVSIEQLYEEPKSPDLGEILEEFQGLRLRFTTKHLLILMVVVSVVLGFGLYHNLFAVLLVTTFVALVGALWYVNRIEQRERKAFYERREAMLEANRKRFDPRDAAPIARD